MYKHITLYLKSRLKNLPIEFLRFYSFLHKISQVCLNLHKKLPIAPQPLPLTTSNSPKKKIQTNLFFFTQIATDTSPTDFLYLVSLFQPPIFL